MLKRLVALLRLKQYRVFDDQYIHMAFPTEINTTGWRTNHILLDQNVDIWLHSIRLNKLNYYKRVEIDEVIVGDSPTGLDIYKKLYYIDWMNVELIKECPSRTTDVLESFSVVYY